MSRPRSDGRRALGPSRPSSAPTRGPLAAWPLPWQRYVDMFRRLTAGAGPYRPLCRTRACYYNRDWVCQFDRVEPAPVGVMEASVCPHALFLRPGGAGAADPPH